jgi:hypothetical protein
MVAHSRNVDAKPWFILFLEINQFFSPSNGLWQRQDSSDGEPDASGGAGSLRGAGGEGEGAQGSPAGEEKIT